MKKIALITDDPIARRVLPKLFKSGGIDLWVFSLTHPCQNRVEGFIADQQGIILDCRVQPESALLGLMEVCGGLMPSIPVVLIHHRNELFVQLLQNRVKIFASIDAGNESLESMIKTLTSTFSSISDDAITQAAGAAEARAIAAPVVRSIQSHSPVERGPPMKPSAQANQSVPETPQAEHNQSVEVPNGSEVRKLKFHELYSDAGLLAKETRVPSGQTTHKAFERSKPRAFERRLSRGETIGKIEGFAQARPLKSSVQMALRIARDSSSTVEDLARVVKQDQALAAQVLQLANCSFHRRGAATRTVEQAIVRLGVAAIRETISGTAMLDQFDDEAGILNVPLLWEHGYAVGMLAADLARATRICSPDEAFIIGLMHDMGRVAMACELGQDYIDALVSARESDVLPTTTEKQFFEYNHADAADTVFKKWDFDLEVTAPIANHHLSQKNVKHLDAAHYRQTCVLQAADTLAHAALLGDSGSDWIDASKLDMGSTSITPGLVRTSVLRASKTLEELRLVATAIDRGAETGNHADNLRAQLPDGITLVALGNLDSLDCMDLLAWRLGGSQWVDSCDSIGGLVGPGDRPDVILGSVRSRDDLACLGHVIQKYDRDGGHVPVVLTIATSALSAQAHKLLGERRVHVLPPVYRVSWVLRGINEVLVGESIRPGSVA